MMRASAWERAYRIAYRVAVTGEWSIDEWARFQSACIAAGLSPEGVLSAAKMTASARGI
jgi:hypothetical protein